ncbi:TPA: Ig-like domain-containing protein [Pasteurella multocida]|nr:Ig-like domain-containing protein [Pasteurella multocida]
MGNYTLHITHNGQTQQIKLTSNEPVVLQAQPDTQYQLFDPDGTLITTTTRVLSAKDLLIYTGDQVKPQVILKNYNTASVTRSKNHLDLENEFATAESLLLSNETRKTTLASEVPMHTNGYAVNSQTVDNNPIIRNIAPKIQPETPTKAEVHINPIANNDVINSENANNNITISGYLTADRAINAATVDVIVNGKTYTANLSEDKATFIVDIDSKEFAGNNQIQVNATVNQGNALGKADAERTYFYDVDIPVAVMTIDSIADNNVINLAASKIEQKLSGSLSVPEDVLPENVQAFVVIGDEKIPVTLTKEGWEVTVPGHKLATNEGIQSIRLEVSLTDSAGNKNFQEINRTYEVDTKLDAPKIEIDPITQDNVINAVETQSQSIIVSGTVKNELATANAKVGDTIVLTVGQAEFSGKLVESNGELHFNVDVDTIALINHRSISAKLETTDNAKNSIDTIQTHNYDIKNQLTEPSITINDVTTDNIINKLESINSITLSGQLTFDNTVKSGSVKVTVNIDDIPRQANVDELNKTWTLTLPADVLVNKVGEKQFSATVLVEDDFGNKASHTSTHSYNVDLDIEKPIITIDNVTSDNIVSINEATGDIKITGNVRNGIEGQNIRISCGCATCVGTKWLELTTKITNGKFSVDFKGAELKSLGTSGNTIVKANYTATDDAGNIAKADETIHKFLMEKENSLPDIAFTLNPVTGDGIINIEEGKRAHIEISGIMRENLSGHNVSSLKLRIGDWESGHINFRGRWDKSFSTNVPQDVLRKNSEIKVIATFTRPGSNDVITLESAEGTHSLPIKYSYDEIAPELGITINPINAGKTINQANMKSPTLISGNLVFDANDIQEKSLRVEVTIDNKVYHADVDRDLKIWTLSIPTNELTTLQGEHSVTAKVFANDIAYNSGENSATATYVVDTVAPMPEITLQIGTDNKVDSSSIHNIEVTGQVTGAFKAGEKAILSINGMEREAIIQNDGKFHIIVNAKELINAPTLSVKATYNTYDEAGNLGTAKTNQPYSISTGDINIELAPITSDDFINVTEGKKAIEISGKISGTNATAESNVTLMLNDKAIKVTVNDDLSFKTTLDISELKLDQNYTIEASVEGNNLSHAKTIRTYDIAPDLIAQIDIDNIADNFVVTPAGMTRISGLVEFSGVYGKGKNAEFLHSVNVKIGEKTYTVGFNGKEKSFFIDIPNSELHSLNGKEISIDFEDLSKAKPSSRVYDISKNNDGSYSMWTNSNVTPEIQTLTLTGNSVNQTGNNTYSINKPEKEMSLIKGTVSGDAKVNDTIEISIGEQNYTTQVLSDKTFNLAVETDHLRSNGNKTVVATLKTQDITGKEILVTDIESYVSKNDVSSDFVSQHSAVNRNNRKTDHTSSDYNFAYFIDGIDQDGIGGFHGNTPIGGNKDPLVVKYSFIAPELAKTELYRPQSIGLLNPNGYEEYSDRYKDFIRYVYKTISEYTNIRFEESLEPLKMGEGTRLYRTELTGYMQWSSAFAWNGGDIVWSKTWGDDNFMVYTAFHEISHTLQMRHSENNWVPVKGYETEASTEFAAMSYNYNSFIDYRNLRVYDLAFLHYRFGVNKEKRTGNDIYGFKDYNARSADGALYIWDGGGVDTFDASNEEKGVNVNLTPGSWIYKGQELSKYLFVKDKTTYTRQEFFDIAKDATVHGQFDWQHNTKQLNNYTKDQGFIGYGTQIENLIGSEHDDILTGNNADNNIYGGAGNDTIKGGKGNDYLDGGKGDDKLFGEEGNDTYFIDSLTDQITELENQGTDTIISTIDYTLQANFENLTLMGVTAKTATGNELNNTLTANNVGNTLEGHAGDDRLVGGLGVDRLTGGDGKDTFVFKTALNGNVDEITDFTLGQDLIELSKDIFTSLNKGMDNLGDFVNYDNASGHLSYDGDGKGIADPIHFATLQPSLNLTIDENNFQIV